mmetsp:Transcript_15419/g.23223  ORF Transcript_15419/g.23223 Transcript_15419/m.23223 type:complete len:142 (-) Transcript_15419:607-1032(-)
MGVQWEAEVDFMVAAVGPEVAEGVMEVVEGVEVVGMDIIIMDMESIDNQWAEDMVHRLQDMVELHRSMAETTTGGGRGHVPVIVMDLLRPAPVITGGEVQALLDGREIVVTEGEGDLFVAVEHEIFIFVMYRCTDINYGDV